MTHTPFGKVDAVGPDRLRQIVPALAFRSHEQKNSSLAGGGAQLARQHRPFCVG
jgi:hypothetical protein